MKKKYDESKAKIASQQQRISFLERENFHLKADNIYLTQKINEISDVSVKPPHDLRRRSEA